MTLNEFFSFLLTDGTMDRCGLGVAVAAMVAPLRAGRRKEGARQLGREHAAGNARGPELNSGRRGTALDIAP